MGSEFYKNFDIVKKIFKQANEKFNFPISNIILKVQKMNYNLLKILNQQFLTVSYSIFKVLKKEFGFNFESFNFFAGHSLGEISALVCSQLLKFSDAIYLFMKEENLCNTQAVPVGQGSMIKFLGLKTEEIPT